LTRAPLDVNKEKLRQQKVVSSTTTGINLNFQTVIAKKRKIHCSATEAAKDNIKFSESQEEAHYGRSTIACFTFSEISSMFRLVSRQI
jgi:hypothetical protein